MPDGSRVVGRAHGYVHLADGCRLCFGTSWAGWWATLYGPDGRSRGGAAGKDLHEALQETLFKTGADYADVIIPVMSELGMEA